MKFWVDTPFTYTTKSGLLRHVRFEGYDYSWHIFDTTDIRYDLPNGWTPPLIGLRPMDSAAQTALNNARFGKTGIQLPGIGLLPANEPIFNP